MPVAIADWRRRCRFTDRRVPCWFSAAADVQALAESISRHADRMLGPLHHVVLNRPYPAALAAFYSRLLGQPITYQSNDWVVSRRPQPHTAQAWLSSLLRTTHRRHGLIPPVPRQFHLDVMVQPGCGLGRAAGTGPRGQESRRRECLCGSGRSPVLPCPQATVGTTDSRRWLIRSMNALPAGDSAARAEIGWQSG